MERANEAARSRRQRRPASSPTKNTWRSTTRSCGTCARSATARRTASPEWEELRQLRLRHQGTHAQPSRRLSRGVREKCHQEWRQGPLGTRRRRTQSDRFRHPCGQGAKTLVKSKSMLTEECDMRPFLERRGIEVIETDLGERIQQLDDEPPSHSSCRRCITCAATSRCFARKLGTEAGNEDVQLPRREPASHHAALFPARRRRHDRRQFRGRRDRRLRRLHQ